MSGWHDAEELAQKVDSASDGMFVKLADDGDKVVGVFIGDPLAREVHWNGERYVSCIGEGCDFCAKGKKPGLRVAINFFQLPEKSLFVESLEARHGKAQGKPAGEVDPFA